MSYMSYLTYNSSAPHEGHHVAVLFRGQFGQRRCLRAIKRSRSLNGLCVRLVLLTAYRQHLLIYWQFLVAQMMAFYSEGGSNSLLHSRSCLGST